MRKKRQFFLEELYIINGHYYWQCVSKGDDLIIMKELMKLYKEKYNDSLFRLIEVM